VVRAVASRDERDFVRNRRKWAKRNKSGEDVVHAYIALILSYSTIVSFIIIS